MDYILKSTFLPSEKCFDTNLFGSRLQLHRTKDAWKHLAALQRKKKKKNRAKCWTESQDFPRCLK